MAFIQSYGTAPMTGSDVARSLPTNIAGHSQVPRELFLLQDGIEIGPALQRSLHHRRIEVD